MAAIEVGIAAEIAVGAADGRVAAAVAVDAGDVVAVVAAADGTAVVVMADTAEDDTRGEPQASGLWSARTARAYVSASWSCDFGRGSFFGGVFAGDCGEIYSGRFDWGCEVGHNSSNAAPNCNQSKIQGVPDVEEA